MSLGRDNWDWDPYGNESTTPTNVPNTVNNAFRQLEIQQMNAEANRAKMTTWGLVGLFAVIVFGYMSSTNARRK